MKVQARTEGERLDNLYGILKDLCYFASKESEQIAEVPYTFDEHLWIIDIELRRVLSEIHKIR